jgi:SOS-response transcriptional repressor LexA
MTPRQVQSLAFIREHIAATGVCPSLEEIRVHLGLKSRSGVHRLVNMLVEQGHLRRTPGRARQMEVVARDPFAGVSDDRLLAECARRGLTESQRHPVCGLGAPAGLIPPGLVGA